MMIREQIEAELLTLLANGDYVAKQTIGDGPIEDYEGCKMNLYRAIEGGAELEKIVSPASELYQGKDTYIISYFGNRVILSAAE